MGALTMLAFLPSPHPPMQDPGKSTLLQASFHGGFYGAPPFSPRLQPQPPHDSSVNTRKAGIEAFVRLAYVSEDSDY